MYNEIEEFEVDSSFDEDNELYLFQESENTNHSLEEDQDLFDDPEIEEILL